MAKLGEGVFSSDSMFVESPFHFTWVFPSADKLH